MTDKFYSLVFLARNDEVLLAMKKRGFGAGKWNGVGGKVEPGETKEQAMLRECQEEIGVTPTTYEKVAFHDFIQDADSDAPWHIWVDSYFCTEWQGEPTETEEMAPKWFKQTEIPYDDMWDDDIHWLPLALEGKKLKTSFTFDKDDHMIDKDVRVVASLDER